MKILQINKFYNIKGGADRYFFNLMDILKDNGHTVIPFAMAAKDNESTPHSQYFVDFVDLSKPKFSFKNILRIFYSLHAQKKLKKLLQKEKPDVAHLHNFHHQLSPSIITTLNKHNIPIVATLHDYKMICPNYKLWSPNSIKNGIATSSLLAMTEGGVCEKCNRDKFYNCVKNKCVKNSYGASLVAALSAYFHQAVKIHDKIDLFIAPTEFVKNEFIKFGFDAKKIVVINYAINMNREDCFIPTEQGLTATENNYVLYYGRLAKEKGVDILIQTIARLKSKINLKIVGNGEEKEKLRLIVQKLNLNQRIEFIGHQNNKELKNLIGRASAIIVPSVWNEVCGYVILESLFLEKPIIASKIGGIPEFIIDNQTGLLAKPNDPDDFAQKIDRLLNNPDQANIMAANGKKLVEKRCNPSQHYGEIMTAYSTLRALKNPQSIRSAADKI